MDWIRRQLGRWRSRRLILPVSHIAFALRPGHGFLIVMGGVTAALLLFAAYLGWQSQAVSLTRGALLLVPIAAALVLWLLTRKPGR